MADWDLKTAALLSRAPGQDEAVGEDLIRLADQVAFALDRDPPTQAPEPDAQTLWRQNPHALHPLTTGAAVELHGLADADWNAVNAAFQTRVDAIRARWPEKEAQYLALWRLLAEPTLLPNLPEPLAAALRRWWRVLPADARAPACALWDHQGLASALTGTAQNGRLQPALLQFNIADTQPFITQARRTQDLWAGSYLLSFLCWNLLLSFVEEFGPDCVIQPLLRGQPLVDLWLCDKLSVREGDELRPPDADSLRISNIPNIFTLLLPLDAVETAVENACRRALDKWDAISESARAQFESAADEARLPNGAKLSWNGCDDLWRRQAGAFLRDNLFWAALPLPADPLDAVALDAWLDEHAPFLSDIETEVADLRTVCRDYSKEATGGLLYGLCSRLTAQLLSDRKRVRDFGQIAEPEQKCSLSGALQALAPAWDADVFEKDKLVRVRDWWESLAKVSNRHFKMAGRIRRGERLSAVLATKRIAIQSYFESPGRPGEPLLDRHQFPSTAGIANARLIDQVLHLAQRDAILRERVRAYADAVTKLLGEYLFRASSLPVWRRSLSHVLRDSRIRRDERRALARFTRLDGECLYEEFYEKERLKREFGALFQPDGEALETAGKARAALNTAIAEAVKQHNANVTDAARRFRPLRPTRYYAIIALDGDEMGLWISGRKPESRPLGPALHLGFTDALSGFALHDARRIVEEEHAGKLVYAGGDDVLALVPVSDVMDTLDALYRAFRGVEKGVTDPLPDGFVDRNGVAEIRMGAGTLSAGAVIVHEAVPLTYAMEQARAAEQDAKKRYGRDAFAVRLLKRSGAPVEIGARWRVENRNVPHAVQRAADLIRDDYLSSKLPYAMENSRLEYVEAAWGASETALRAARGAEFGRLARRHLAPPDPGDAAATRARTAFLEAFGRLASAPAAPGYDAWEGTKNLLLLARMIAGEE